MVNFERQIWKGEEERRGSAKRDKELKGKEQGEKKSREINREIERGKGRIREKILKRKEQREVKRKEKGGMSLPEGKR